MGGCKCSFRNCPRSTINDMKIHFFHFPVRDRKRCEQWIINARKAQFHALPSETLRNKVICQHHFESKYFMNYKQDRLTHNAVPTIYDKDDDDMSLNDLNYVQLPQDPLSIPSTSTNSHDKSTTDLSIIPVHVEGAKSTFRILNVPIKKPIQRTVKLNVKDIITPVTETHVKQTTPSRGSNKPECVNENIYPQHEQNSTQSYTVSENGDLKLVPPSQKASTSSVSLSADNIKLEPLSDNEENDSLSIYSIRLEVDHESGLENNIFEEMDDVTITRLNKEQLQNNNHSSELSSINMEQTEDFEVLQRIMNEEREQNPPKLGRRSRTRKHLLFKYISKDLNPVLSTALKMELFRRTKWTDKEKKLAIDLYSATPVGYSVLVNKWGWKFPAVELVQEWLSPVEHAESQNILT